MPLRQPPAAWLFTDNRMGEALWPALARLPRGSGVVFRDRSADRRQRLRRVRAVARARRLLLSVSGGGRPNEVLHLGSVRGQRRHRGMVTASAHSTIELVAARRAGAMLVFVSPVFATASHAGQTPLGRVRFHQLARQAKLPVAALGGMTARRFRTLRPAAVAWGAVDAWL